MKYLCTHNTPVEDEGNKNFDWKEIMKTANLNYRGLEEFVVLMHHPSFHYSYNTQHTRNDNIDLLSFHYIALKEGCLFQFMGIEDGLCTQLYRTNCTFSFGRLLPQKVFLNDTCLGIGRAN